MPYCTIDEAWEQSLISDNKAVNNKIDPLLQYDNSECNYSELYSINTAPKKIPKRMKNKSRTYNRLKNHNGPKTRLPSNKTHVIKEDSIEVSPEEEMQPAYDNSSCCGQTSSNNHTNEFNVSAFENVNREYDNRAKDLTSSSSILEDFKENMESDSIQDEPSLYGNRNMLNNLQEENQKLRRIIAELKESKSGDTNTFMELVMFISTGVVIILMMENINSLVRKF